MDSDRRRDPSEPFIEDNHRFPPDERRREKRPAPPEQDARRRRAQQKRRRNSVFQYIAVLFMAAFALLLYTFMMERRQSQQQIDDLKKSASTVQTLQGLIAENEQLKDQSEALQDQIDALQDQLSKGKQERTGLTSQLEESEKINQAMAWFWEINDASVRGQLKSCREMIAAMEEAGLVDYLPKENTTGTGHLSPADRYQDIRSRVIK